MTKLRADNPFAKLLWFKDVEEQAAWTKSHAPPKLRPWHDHGDDPCVGSGAIRGLYKKTFKMSSAGAWDAYYDLTRNNLVEERFGDKHRWWGTILRGLLFIVLFFTHDDPLGSGDGKEPYLCTIYRVQRSFVVPAGSLSHAPHVPSEHRAVCVPERARVRSRAVGGI